MAYDWTDAAVGFGIVVPIVLGLHAAKWRREVRRRNVWRAAAVRAGVEPELGPWVVGRVAGSWLEAGDHEVGTSRSGYRHWSGLRAPIFAALPDGFAASTSDAQPGIVRARFAAGPHEVLVRGIDTAEVEEFLGRGGRSALGDFFACVPGATLEAGLIDPFAKERWFIGAVVPEIDWERVTGTVRVLHRERIDETSIEREVVAFVRLVTALHEPKDAYR